MDDYMKEMIDLKTLVTKTLEKKGVLARIRAELRANVFQAIEEQDHVSESEGGDSFALLGRCSERAKLLHDTPAGKLLTGLVCEYLEWCELDRTLKVYLPELNQPRTYSRTELEELLERKSDRNGAGVSSEARPLLMDVLEGYLKSEVSNDVTWSIAVSKLSEKTRNLLKDKSKGKRTLETDVDQQTTSVKDGYPVSSSSFPKSSRNSSSLGSKALTNGSEVEDEELRGVLESRLTLSNSVVDPVTSALGTSAKKCMGGLWHPESCSPRKETASSVRSGEFMTPAVDDVSKTRHDDAPRNPDKPPGRLSNLGGLPLIAGRRGGLAPMILANSTGRVGAVVGSTGGKHEPLDVSASDFSLGIGGNRDGYGKLSYLENGCPSLDENTSHRGILGVRREDVAGSGEVQRADILGGDLRQRHCREPGDNLDGGEREGFSVVTDTSSVGSKFMEQPGQQEDADDKSLTCGPGSADLTKCCVTPGGDNSCAKTQIGEWCARQKEDTSQFPPCLDDKISSPSVLRKKSASAYFYSESDDDASIPAEDFNDDSDEESDLQQV